MSTVTLAVADPIESAYGSAAADFRAANAGTSQISPARMPATTTATIPIVTPVRTFFSRASRSRCNRMSSRRLSAVEPVFFGSLFVALENARALLFFCLLFFCPMASVFRSLVLDRRACRVRGRREPAGGKSPQQEQDGGPRR